MTGHNVRFALIHRDDDNPTRRAGSSILTILGIILFVVDVRGERTSLPVVAEPVQSTMMMLPATATPGDRVVDIALPDAARQALEWHQIIMEVEMAANLDAEWNKGRERISQSPQARPAADTRRKRSTACARGSRLTPRLLRLAVAEVEGRPSATARGARIGDPRAWSPRLQPNPTAGEEALRPRPLGSGFRPPSGKRAA